MTTISRHIALVEIDLPLLLDPSKLENEEAGIWRYDITFAGNEIVFSDDGLVLSFPEHSETTYNIKSLEVDDVEYLRTSGLDNLRLQDQAFYYDQWSGIIYVTFPDYEPPLARIIRCGAVTGFSKGYDFLRPTVKAYYNNLFYEPVVRSLPAITKSRDPLNYGIMRFSNWSISFDNTGATFDGLTSEALFGASCRVKIGEFGDDYAEFRTIAEGKIRKYRRNSTEFAVDVVDDRFFLDATVIENRFNTTDYPGLEDDDIDKPIPWVYGVCRNVPCVHVGSGTFVFADTTYHDVQGVAQVYVDGVATANGGTETDGTFTIAGYTDGDVTADVVGFVTGTGGVIDNPLDVILDILENRLNIVFSSDNFFQGEWSAETPGAPDVSVFINDEKKINELIEELATGANGQFYQRDDGRFSFRSFIATRTPSRTLVYDEYLDADIPAEYATDAVLSKVVIKYNPDYSDDKNTRTAAIDDYATEVFSVYGVRNQQELDTYISSEADARAIGAEIAEYNSTVRPVITIKTGLQHVGAEVGDFVIASKDRYAVAMKNYDVWEVLSTTKNLDEFTIAFKLRYVSEYNEVDTLYTQGEVFAGGVFGGQVFGVTLYEVA